MNTANNFPPNKFTFRTRDGNGTEYTATLWGGKYELTWQGFEKPSTYSADSVVGYLNKGTWVIISNLDIKDYVLSGLGAVEIVEEGVTITHFAQDLVFTVSEDKVAALLDILYALDELLEDDI